MFELGLRRALKFRDDALCEHFPQFDTPLVEGVNLPDDTLCEDAVFVQSNEFSE